MSSQAELTVAKLVHDEDGSFKRHVSTFRNVIEKGGEFEPEQGRYHLYVALTCPIEHIRQSGRLNSVVLMTGSVGAQDVDNTQAKGFGRYNPGDSAVSTMGDEGWAFKSADPFPGTEDDPNMGAKYLRELYFAANENYQGRFTVPVLWDKKHKTIVNNESSEIIRNLNSAFYELVPEAAEVDLYPEVLRKEIDEVNDWMYDGINNGVYKAGFAATQSAYEEAVRLVFKFLDRLEVILKAKPPSAEGVHIVGDQLTEADVRAYVTIRSKTDVGFASLNRIRDGYPAIRSWLKQLYWKNPAFHGTTDFSHIKAGYYGSKAKMLSHMNPTHIIPLGPVPDIESP